MFWECLTFLFLVVFFSSSSSNNNSSSGNGSDSTHDRNTNDNGQLLQSQSQHLQQNQSSSSKRRKARKQQVPATAIDRTDWSRYQYQLQLQNLQQQQYYQQLPHGALANPEYFGYFTQQAQPLPPQYLSQHQVQQDHYPNLQYPQQHYRDHRSLDQSKVNRRRHLGDAKRVSTTGNQKINATQPYNYSQLPVYPPPPYEEHNQPVLTTTTAAALQPVKITTTETTTVEPPPPTSIKTHPDMAKKKQSGHQKKARTSQAPSTQKNRTAATASAASVTDTRLKPTKLEREGIKKFPQLAMHGLYPRYVEADGNCMFRALADQLSGTDAEHRRLRAEVCDYIAAHRERFEGFMMDMEFDDYVARMRDELWGDGCALVAFAKIRGVNVIVYSEGVDAPPMRIGCNDDDDLSDAASSIKLSRRKGGKDNTKKKRESAVAAKRMRNSSSRKRTVHGGGGGGGSSKIGDYEPNDGGTAAAEYLGKRRPTFYLALDDEEHYWSVRRIAEPTSGASNIDPNLEGEF